ncbi:MAG: hypothetical protein J1E39_03670 [Eubacterium sp.]|nr:hypothetical protein [Eubacterium sp.]
MDWLFNIFGITLDGFINSIFDGIITYIYQALFTAVRTFMTMINQTGVNLFSLPWVNTVISFFGMLGWALFVIGSAVAVSDVVIEYRSGKSGGFQPLGLNVLKGFLAAGLFTVVPIRLYNFAVMSQDSLAADIIGSFDQFGNFSLAVFGNHLIDLLFLLGLIYSVVKLFLANIKRGGILLILISVGTLYMMSVPRGFTDGFNGWIKQVIAICFTAFMQTTLCFIGMITIQTDAILGLCLLLSSTEVSRIADRFGMDTSIRGNITAAAMTANTAMSAVRMIRAVR